MREADLIVIGAGVLGTFHAHFAAEKGLKTLLIERNAAPNDATTRNFGMVLRTIVATNDPWSEYARDSAEIYRAIQREHDISVTDCGSLYLASTELERCVLEEFADTHSRDYGCEYLDTETTAMRFPFVRRSYCRGALFSPDDLSLDPRSMIQRLISYVMRSGRVEYIPNTTAISVETTDQRCLVRDAGGMKYAADRVVVCAGADFKTLFPDHLRDSGLRVCKLQMMRTMPLSGFTLPVSVLSGLSILRYPAFREVPSYEALLSQPVDAELTEYGVHVLIKQSPDGSVIIGDSHEYRPLADADSLYERTNCRINDAILTYARSMIDLPDWTIDRLWNGFYLVHPELPIYTHTIDDRIHIVTGIAGKGMSTAPGFARYSVDRLLG